jgi:hypothetical protein
MLTNVLSVFANANAHPAGAIFEKGSRELWVWVASGLDFHGHGNGGLKNKSSKSSGIPESFR